MASPPTGQFAPAWRDAATRDDWLHVTWFTDLARDLERLGYTMLFVPDALAVAEDAGGSPAAALASGAKGAIYLDPITTLAACAGVTRDLLLGATVSTSFAAPYDIARRLATLHQLTGGRAAWNIVTSAFDAEARNMDRDSLPDRAARYARADEVVDQVLALWEGFPAAALVRDRERGRFADVTAIHGAGTAGPLSLPGLDEDAHRPVLMQAGASPRGRDFAARWADLVFTVAADADQARALRSDLRERAAAAGRDPDAIRCLMGIQPVVATSSAAAERHLANMTDLADRDDALTGLANLFRQDPASLDPEESSGAFLDRNQGATGAVGFEDAVRTIAETSCATVEELALRNALSQFKPMPVGSGAEVAAEMNELLISGAADGFVIMGALGPDSFRAIGETVLPHLGTTRP